MRKKPEEWTQTWAVGWRQSGMKPKLRLGVVPGMETQHGRISFSGSCAGSKQKVLLSQIKMATAGLIKYGICSETNLREAASDPPNSLSLVGSSLHSWPTPLLSSRFVTWVTLCRFFHGYLYTNLYTSFYLLWACPPLGPFSNWIACLQHNPEPVNFYIILNPLD